MLGKDRGPVMPVPKGIRPTLSKHRIEVRSSIMLWTILWTMLVNGPRIFIVIMSAPIIPTNVVIFFMFTSQLFIGNITFWLTMKLFH